MKTEQIQPNQVRAAVVKDEKAQQSRNVRHGYDYSGPNGSLTEESFERAISHIRRDKSASVSLELSGYGRVLLAADDPWALPAIVAHLSRIPAHAIRDASDKIARGLGLAE